MFVAPFTVCLKLVPDTELIGLHPVVVPEAAGDVLDLTMLSVPAAFLTTPRSTHDLKSPTAPEPLVPPTLTATVSD